MFQKKCQHSGVISSSFYNIPFHNTKGGELKLAEEQIQTEEQVKTKDKTAETEKLVGAEKAKGLMSEFQTFLGDSSVFDMAIGVIIGTALSKIVSSLVNDIFMPLIGIVIGGVNFASLTFQVHGATVNYGTFISNVVDFLIIAVCLFGCTKAVLTFKHKLDPEVDATYKKETAENILLLREIRDELQIQNGKKIADSKNTESAAAQTSGLAEQITKTAKSLAAKSITS